jgi:RNA polymerase sigma factor (sigma-70 family)
MAGYRLAAIELLKEQLLFTPRRVLKEQVVRLYDLTVFHIHPQRMYPYDFICHRITGYRPPTDAEALFEGRDLERDLSLMLLELSARAAPSPAAFREPTYSLDELARLWGVSPHTILRWQEHAPLPGCYVEDEGGRRLAFRFAAVLRFIRDNPALVDGVLAEALLSPACRKRVVAAARRSRKRSRTLSDLAQHLGERLRLSPTLVEYVLAPDLRKNPDLGVYQGFRPTLSEAGRRRALELFEHGRRLADIARELGCDRRTAYRSICREKAAEVFTSEVTYVDSPEFHQRRAEASILAEPESLQPAEATEPPTDVHQLPEDLPPYIRELYRTRLLGPERERWLFRKYNFSKFRMGELRQELRRRPSAMSLIRAYGRFESEAFGCRRELVRSNLRLVVSIAKKHLGPQTDFETLVSDGNMSLLAAIERFDYMKGFKFSTYASWAIIKNFAKSIPEENYRLRVYLTGVPELMDEVAADGMPARFAGTPWARELEPARPAAHLRETVSALLCSLSQRERFILAARFGLAAAPGSEAQEPQTLEAIGQQLSLSRERVRQLERRALARLRELVEQ